MRETATLTSPPKYFFWMKPWLLYRCCLTDLENQGSRDHCMTFAHQTQKFPLSESEGLRH